MIKYDIKQISYILYSIAVGAISIGELLSINHTLQVLTLGENDIGDDGVIAIAGGLGKSSIKELNVKKCGFAFPGAEALASAISHSQIRKLWLQRNKITMKGTYLLLKAAVENGVCETLGLDPFDSVVQKELKEAKKMEEILESRKINKPVVSC